MSVKLSAKLFPRHVEGTGDGKMQICKAGNGLKGLGTIGKVSTNFVILLLRQRKIQNLMRILYIFSGVSDFSRL